MDEFRNEIISRIRSCLISTKGQVTLRQLEDDYRTLLGERIPYAKLGYKSLESFITSIPTIITSRSPSGEIFVDAQVSEKTAHISSMVRKQKSVPKKHVRIAPKFNRAMAQPPPNATKWRPKQKPMMRKNYNTPKLAAVSHNQFVSGSGYRKPQVPSKVVVVERKEEVKKDNVVEVKRNSLEKEEEASPFSSTMKRITKIMKEITTETDSGTSSPTTDYAAGYKLSPDFIKTGDPISDLRNFVTYHKLGDVEVTFTETKMKKSKMPQWHCKLTVGPHIYSSYPEDFYDQNAAERHASQKALDYLMQKYGQRRSLLLSSNDDIIERIPPMLEKHNNAVWMWQIEADYRDRFNEQLPPDWLQIIDNSPFVSIEKYHGRFVLQHCNPDNKGKKLDISLNIADVSVPCNTVNFGDSNRLYAVVTVAHSVNEIWCQHCGTPEYEKFVEMTETMETFYNNYKTELKANVVNSGSCYVIQHEGSWIRVRALKIPEHGIVDCFLIDYGEEVHVSIDNVYLLKRQFATEQAQAFVCRLDGLEDLYEASLDSEHLTALVGKEFVLEIVTDDISDTGDVTLPVVIYDVTSGASINEELISSLTIESAMPVLEKESISEVYVSNIEPNGDVYIQIRTIGYFSLMEDLENLTRNLSNISSLSKPTKENSVGKIYLVRCKVSQKWLRATIVDWSPKGDLAQIYFIDQGNAQVVNVNNEKMYELDKLDNVLSQYPSQAIKVRFMIEKIPSDFVKKAEKLLPKDRPVLLKIISYDNENVAWVEFFKRTTDGVLVFINKSISVEAELQQNIDVSNNNEINRKRLLNLVQYNDANKNVPSGGSLRKPDLPKIGDYFNVNIPFAVNPWNFFVQPLDSFARLKSMMDEMQEHYKDIQFSPMALEDIVPGKIYASKHDDGQWYRTNVLKVIHATSISVFYCDFGYYTNLKLHQLVPLDAKYMSLPYQALKAKISGIKPIKNKWTMEDCESFKELILKKQFVGVITNIDRDEFHKSDLILEMLLIDTSSEEDVNIKEVLIRKGIATSV
ncbi:tudor domain-containing protein 7-like isoform X2 [Tribolium madens]|uniref:tudor domain-containing protein 7-like isoform X2 n=1 Tax=Tribolium madens TaxID=41895 RepID=UPI001CF74A4B|nr:tudor domain-containing protein 7-like isoform X2 [Tribolium madens]